jgi:hypothetical protein
MEFGTLAGGLGCFPFDYEPYHPQSDSRATLDGIRSLIGVGNLVRPLAHSVLYLQQRSRPRLYLNIFRGEPAISEFDWPFTPTHSSSPKFSTLVGSVLHAMLLALQPGHG